jgi:hypothetical protein
LSSPALSIVGSLLLISAGEYTEARELEGSSGVSMCTFVLVRSLLLISAGEYTEAHELGAEATPVSICTSVLVKQRLRCPYVHLGMRP